MQAHFEEDFKLFLPTWAGISAARVERNREGGGSKMDKKYFTPAEAAEILEVKEETVLS